MLGLDVGSKRIGVAHSDELGILATPRGAIQRRSYNRDIAAISQLAHELDAERIIVGLPVGLSGQPTEQTRRCQQFATVLASRVAVPVELCDERLTTVTAARRLAERRGPLARGDLDAAAAAVILQAYLDGQRSSSAPS